MTIATEAGYSWTNGTHARLLHEGNRLPKKTISASNEAIAGNAQLVENGLTRDRWKPFLNEVPDAENLNGDGWNALAVTVADDGRTLAETAATSAHRILQAFTFTNVEWVVAARVQRQTVPEIRLVAEDGTTSPAFGVYFDLRDGTVGTAASGAVGEIVDLGGNEFLCLMRFTPVAGTGDVRLFLSDGAETFSYAGSTDNTIAVLEFIAHPSVATLRFDTFGARAATCFAIGAHTLFSAGATITFQHDSNGDDTWADIGAVTPTDDSALMFFFDSITSDRWRIQISGGVLPEVGVLRIGDPLVMQRAIYAGASPARMNRNTDVIGNLSRSGELLGRSVKRTTLKESYNWQRLTYDWVRANLDGPNGVIQSLEAKTAFIAWRPSQKPDAAYIMRGTTGAPTAQGQVNLWSFSLQCEVYAYE